MNDDDIQEWIEKGEQQEVTYHNIIVLVNRDDNEYNKNDDETGQGLQKM